MAGWAPVYSRSCAPAQDVAARTTQLFTMAPVPKQAPGSSTEKRAQKARPSHHKGVSLIPSLLVMVCFGQLLWWLRDSRANGSS